MGKPNAAPSSHQSHPCCHLDKLPSEIVIMIMKVFPSTFALYKFLNSYERANQLYEKNTKSINYAIMPWLLELDEAIYRIHG